MGLENPLHILILLVVVLLVFGAKRLPEIGRSLGDGMRGFKDSLNGQGTHESLPGGQPHDARLTAASSNLPAPAPIAVFGRSAIDPDDPAQARDVPRAA